MYAEGACPYMSHICLADYVPQKVTKSDRSIFPLLHAVSHSSWPRPKYICNPLRDTTYIRFIIHDSKDVNCLTSACWKKMVVARKVNDKVSLISALYREGNCSLYKAALYTDWLRQVDIWHKNTVGLIFHFLVMPLLTTLQTWIFFYPITLLTTRSVTSSSLPLPSWAVQKYLTCLCKICKRTHLD